MQFVRTRFENLSKRIALSGIASRNQADKMIIEGRVRVDGHITKSNFEVPDIASVFLSLDHGEQIIPPPPELPRLWALGKPRGVMCDLTRHSQPVQEDSGTQPEPSESTTDSQSQQTSSSITPATLRDVTSKWGEENELRYGIAWTEHSLPPHVIPINRLGLNDKGIVLLTTDGDFANKLKDPESLVLSQYRVKVGGAELADYDPEKPFRPWGSYEGVKCNGIDYGRVFVQVVKRLPTGGAYLKIQLVANKTRDISELLYHTIGLRVYKMTLESFGPYKMSELSPGQTSIMPVHPSLKKFVAIRPWRDALVPAQGNLIDPTTKRPKRIFTQECF